MRPCMLVVRSGLAALALALAAPVAAQAASATLSSGALTVTGDASNEQLVVSSVGANVRVEADTGGLADPDGAGTDCALLTATTAECLDTAVDSIVVNGGAGNDWIIVALGNNSDDLFTGNGQAGNDILQSDVANPNTFNDTMNGGADDDTINGVGGVVDGGDGNDTLNTGPASQFSPDDTGGPGDDVLNGSNAYADDFAAEPGADTYNGGTTPLPAQLPPGDEFTQGGDCTSFCGATDTMTYPGSAAVTVTLDGVANDGAAGEGDNVKPDIETVRGGSGNDTLDASASATEPKSLYGGPGDDTLTGGAKGDRLQGGNGSDTVNGGPGADRLIADEFSDSTQPAGNQAGNDSYNGGPGDDVFGAVSTVDTTSPGQTSEEGGGLGADVYNGGPGEDSITVARTAYSPRVPDATDPSSMATTYVPVSVTLDDPAADGYPGSALTISGIEDVTTGAGADTISGNAASNVLDGGSGNDTIDGRGGVDLIDGGDGVDAITSRDLGFDRVDCGLGIDTPVQGDVGDELTGCEGDAVLTPLPAPAAPADTTAPTATLGGRTTITARAFARARSITVTVTPNEPVLLEGRLFSGTRSGIVGQVLLGKRSLGLGAGVRTLKFKVSRALVKRTLRQARSRAHRRRGYAITVTVRATDAAGLSSTASRTIRIKA